MKLLIGYATKEGQTRRIARYIADFVFDAGHSVELVALSHAEEIDIARFDTVILLAPIHSGHYPKSISAFASSHSTKLNQRLSYFISVSLAAAGHSTNEWRQLDHIADDFRTATGWNPTHIKQVAGAYRPSQYDVLTGFIMRRIISKKDDSAEPGEDKEYTDWQDLDSCIRQWLSQSHGD